MFSFILIALISVLIGIAVLAYNQIKKNRGPREKAVGITAADVGAGEIEMDGSSTLSPAPSNNDLALDEEDAVVTTAADGGGGDQAFTISDSHDDEDAEGSDSEPTIV